MSLPHHGPEQGDLLKRFLSQQKGADGPTYSQGKMGADDEGDLIYKMATDDRNKTIIIEFPKPVKWIGLGVSEALELRDQLTERLLALRGISK